METNVADKAVVHPQQCWKTMLKKCEMQKVVSRNSIETSADKTRSESVQIYLDENLKSFTYLTDSEENKIEISSISSIRSGDELDSKNFSVELKTDLKLVNFVAPNVTLAEYWIHGLQRLVDNQFSSPKGTERRIHWLRETFRELSTSNHHDLKYTHVYEKVLNCKHHVVTEEFFKLKMKEFMKKKKLKYRAEDGFLILENFTEFYKYIFDRREVLNLFQRMASNGAFISATDLEYYLTEEQHLGVVTQESCREIIVTYEVTQVGREKFELNVDGFTYLLLSVHGQLFNQYHDRVYQDMQQPVPHYYIASSHNTYLLGRQLKGDSSAQAYSEVIEKGCRCVELDCWDGDDDEPIVYHGHTLTTKILFKDIIKSIDESAFKTSPYPVIVSLENHCSSEVQKKMASYMIEIFGDKMHRIPVNKSMGEFPSPEFFKYKILIRGKVDTADTVDDAKDTNGVKSNLEQESEKAKKNENEDELKEKRNSIVEVTSSSDGHMDVPAGTASTSELAAPTSPSTRSRGLIFSDSKKKVAKELSKLINYISNSKFISFEESAKNGKFWQSSSFVEGDMESYADKNAAAFINFNRRQLSRIYPGGMRIDSSNYNPIKAWNVGSQIVALNHQTNDEPMALYYGKFRQNGKAGYVLKPAFLRDPSIKFNPNSITKPTIGSKVLKMTIISGQQLPEEPDSWAFAKDVPDPYVLVQVYGVPADEFIFTTSTHYDNSFNPTWNESFETKILVPELAMIKFSVYDKDIGFDDFIGQSTLPFESLQQGYRHVPLLDKEGVAIPCASIFIHVLCEELVQNSQHKDQSN